MCVNNEFRKTIMAGGLKRMRPKPSGNYLGNGRGKLFAWNGIFRMIYVMCCKFALCAFKFAYIILIL